MLYIYTVISVILIIIAFLISFRKCPKKMMLVIFNRLNGNMVISSISWGSAFVMPFFMGFITVPSEPMTMVVDIYGASVKSGDKIDQSFIFTVQFSKRQEFLQNAVDNMKFLKGDNVIDNIRNIIYDEIETVLSKLSLSQIGNEKEFIERITYNVRNIVKDYGLELTDSRIRQIKENK